MVEQSGLRTQTRQSRRHVLATMATAGSAVMAVGAFSGLTESHAQVTGTPDASPRLDATPESNATPDTRLQTDDDAIAHIAPPDWSFTVYTVRDPYELPEASTLVVPPGTHYFATEVEINNASNQPLSFAASQIRLRATDGLEYTAGGAAGPETTLKARVLPPGDLTRGWLWFNVPDDAELTKLVFIAQSPEFSLSLTD